MIEHNKILELREGRVGRLTVYLLKTFIFIWCLLPSGKRD
jgi:hypothetical protein